MDRHFCTFVNNQQDDWLDKLFIAEFIANNNNFAFIKLSSFFALRGLYLCISFDVIDFSNITICKEINMKKVIEISKAMQSLWKYA